MPFTAADYTNVASDHQSQLAQKMPEPSHWDELEDYENMQSEWDVEPDYYIDRAPHAQFKPMPKGSDKTTQVHDRVDRV